MIEVVSIKFKNRGKCYYFDPARLTVCSGDKVIVETSKGLEIADCTRGNHAVSDELVVQPLRPVVRIATPDDLKIAETNRQREKEAFDICQKKIAEHRLDMKLVDVECNFEGSKTLFFFTSDGRVDFRDLVKDLAGIFRNRIELRQIGVRDEAKMLGGIGICGRPYCCNQFLDDFQPVSTKMAKVQSLSLNPTKISGSCGRLMCCLRYEQDAYEDLLRSVPKQGAFVQTRDGYGTAVQVNLLRQTVKVRLDKDSDDSLHLYNSNELAAIPGGRPKDGSEPPSVLTDIPETDTMDTDAADAEPEQWDFPELYVSESSQNAPPDPVSADEPPSPDVPTRHGSRSRRQKEGVPQSKKPAAEKPRGEDAEQPVSKHPVQKKKKGENMQVRERKAQSSTKHPGKAATVKPVKITDNSKTASAASAGEGSEASAPNSGEQKAENPKKSVNRRHYYHGKPKNKGTVRE